MFFQGGRATRWDIGRDAEGIEESEEHEPQPTVVRAMERNLSNSLSRPWCTRTMYVSFLTNFEVSAPHIDVNWKPGFLPAQDLTDFEEFEAYFRQELPKVIQSHSNKEVWRDQICFDDTLKTVQYFHSLVMSNYRPRLASEPANIDSTNNTSSPRPPSALLSSIKLPSAPIDTDGTPCTLSEPSADTGLEEFAQDFLDEFVQDFFEDFDFTS